MVFRLTNGKINLLRRDKVAPGGHKSSGWIPILRSTDLIAPDVTKYVGGL